MLLKLLNVFKESMTIKKKTEEKAEKNSRRLKKKEKTTTKQNKQTENPSETCAIT